MNSKPEQDTMHKDAHLLIVGGTGRNVGKTEFVCRLISRISAAHEVYALKVSAIFPDEEMYHGDHKEEGNHLLFEETRRDTRKDTARMLRAGASRVFYLRSEENTIRKGYKAFRRQVPHAAAIICESNSLGQWIKPALQIMIRNKDGEVKLRALPRLQEADLVVVSDGVSGFAEIQRIDFDPSSSWTIY